MPDQSSIHLGEPYDTFIAIQIQQGHFDDASDVIRAGLHLLREYESRTEELRALIDDAEVSVAKGEGRSYATPDDLTNAILAKNK